MFKQKDLLDFNSGGSHGGQMPPPIVFKIKTFCFNLMVKCSLREVISPYNKYKHFSFIHIIDFYKQINLNSVIVHSNMVLHVDIIITSRFACFRCAACKRYASENRPSGVSKNYATRLANLSCSSGSSSTYKYLQFMGL